MPGAVLGAFLARLLGEWVGLPNVGVAAALTLAMAAVGAWLLSRLPFAQTWPALLLLGYLAYPERNPAIAAWVAAAALAMLVLLRLDFPGRLSRLLPVAVLLIGLAVYVGTLSPDVLPADSGELQAVAAQLGVAHPPGFALYTMLGHLMTRLPLGPSAAWRLNLFSAVTSAAALAVVYLVVVRLTRRPGAGLVAALALGTATTWWVQATTTNVRSLTALFTALILYCLIRWRDERAAGRGDRWLIAAALATGLGVTHHPSLVFLLPPVLLFVALTDPRLLREPRRWLWPVVAGLAGLLPLLYFPLRANSGTRGASADLATWPGFLEHVLATGFRGDLFHFIDPASLWQRLGIMVNVLSFQFDALILLGIAVGLMVLLRGDRRAALLLGGAAALFTLVAATYRAPQTVEYMMPAYVALAIALGVGVGQIGRALPAAAALLGALLLVGGLRQGLTHVPEPDTSARDYAAALLADAPPDSTILAHWHWVTPLWYLQEVEGLRPDVESRFVFPDGESYDANWDSRTREAFAAGRPVVTTYVPPVPREGLPVPEPLGEALVYLPAARMSPPAGYTPVGAALGDGVEVSGYALQTTGDGVWSLDDEAVVVVAWRAAAGSVQSLFVHALGPDGALWGQADVAASAAEGLTLTRFPLWLRPGAPVGPYTLNFGAAAVGEADRLTLTTLKVVAAGRPPTTVNPLRRPLLDGSGRHLIGYDWDTTLPARPRLYLHWRDTTGYRTQVVDMAGVGDAELPPVRGPWGVPGRDPFARGREDGQYVPFGGGLVWTGDGFSGDAYAIGDTVPINVHLRSDRAIRRDYVVSVRLMGLMDDGVSWAWWDLEDSVPAMGAIPTLKWISGSVVRSPHRPQVQPAATAGQRLTGALTVYDSFTNRPVPILDERLTALAPWVPQGEAQVTD